MVKKEAILIDMGNRLRHQRKQMKMTQEKLAEISGLSVKTIISAEKGKKGLRPENIVCLCQVLAMDVSYFMTGRTLEGIPTLSLSHLERMALDKILEAFFRFAIKIKNHRGINSTMRDYAGFHLGIL